VPLGANFDRRHGAVYNGLRALVRLHPVHAQCACRHHEDAGVAMGVCKNPVVQRGFRDAADHGCKHLWDAISQIKMPAVGQV
jgi:hypothetical protein